jgi:hypothetical protein
MEQSKYALLLKERGDYVIEVDGIFWYKYNRFMVPAYLPHCVPDISQKSAIKVLKISGGPFVRWDTSFNKIQNSEWWYILKRGPWNIDDVKDKKKRWMIRQGVKNFTTRPLTSEEVVRLCPAIAINATGRYKGELEVETEEILAKRIEAAKKVLGVLEYIGCFFEDKLVSFSENYIQNDVVWLAVIRHDPQYLKYYSSYGLMNGILEYYLNRFFLKYVLDGSRSIHHKTNFQEHLINVFGFTKEYANLNISYSTLFGIFVKSAYPFRKLFWKFAEKSDSFLLNNISAILKQEYIVRSCLSNSQRNNNCE